MGYAYSPFNPLIWLLFIGFCIITYVIVKLFHRRYPHYPDTPENEEEMEEVQEAQTRGKSSAARWACAETGEPEKRPHVGRIK